MKCVLFFAGVLLLQMTGIQCDEFAKTIEECGKESGITEDMFKEGAEKNQDKPEFRCLIACAFKKLGILEPGNKINTEKEKEILIKYFGNKVDEIMQEEKQCIEEAKDIADECDFSNAISNCMKKKFPDMS